MFRTSVVHRSKIRIHSSSVSISLILLLHVTVLALSSINFGLFCFLESVEPLNPIGLGCFKDTGTTRAFSELLKIFHGQNYAKIIQECAALAKSKGYTVFGIQYFGECWSGNNGHKTYNRNGPSKHCADGIGKDWSNFVYEILEGMLGQQLSRVHTVTWNWRKAMITPFIRS